MLLFSVEIVISAHVFNGCSSHKSDVELVGQQKVVERTVDEKAIVKGQQVEGTLVERSTNEQSVVEGLVTEDTFNKKLELDKLSVKRFYWYYFVICSSELFELGLLS